MANCPKCKEYIIGVERHLVEVRGVDHEGGIHTGTLPDWQYSKFRHECGYVFDVEDELDGTFVNLKGLKDGVD